jgi:hypothetical protein
MQNSTSADKNLFEVNSSLGSFDVFRQPFSFVANELVKQIFEQSSATQVWNLYGPTEDTTYSTYALIDKENNGRVPIGRPVAYSQVYLLDQQLQPDRWGSRRSCIWGAKGWRAVICEGLS